MRRTPRSQTSFFRVGLALLATALVGAVPVVTPRAPEAAATTLAPPRPPGYWLAGSDGSVYPFGSAGDLGSLRGTPLARPVTGMAPTPSGDGYWLVASDGGIFSFGDATFYGSTGDIKLNKPIVGMAPTPTGKGYWFVASDGGIFSFGDATFYGSTGDIKLNKPIVGMAPTPTGKGYWFVAADGGIFNFGDARFEGSAGGQPLPAGIVVMAGVPGGTPAPAPTPTGPGGTGPTPTTAPTTVTTGPAPTGEAFQIALVGDSGYRSEHLAVFDSVVAHMNSFPLAFAVHDGDFKDPLVPCTDQRFEAARTAFNKSAAPFVYAVGDNEWMDCAATARDPKDPIERLAKLRELFFPADESLGVRRMPLATQRRAGYPENTRWTREGVVFATLNAPGDNDNLPYDVDHPNAPEAGPRRLANVAWLNATFDEAEATGAAAVMVIWQANPWQFFAKNWKYLTDVLRQRTIDFGKPVVLVHGDTHIHRIDGGGKANADGSPDSNWPALSNFTRVETFAAGPPAGGGTLQPEKWLRVTVDPKSPQVFTFHPETAPPA